MPTPTLAQLIAPSTPDDVNAIFLATLAGIGPVVQVGSGQGSVVVSGQPQGQYDVLLVIQTPGAPGTSTFKYTLDDGNTWNGPYSVPAGGYNLSGGGLLFNFSGTFEAGDVFQFQTIFPPFPTTDWNTGNPGRQFIQGEAIVVSDQVSSTIPEIAGSGFLAYASDAGAPNSWFDLLADQMYQVDRANPTFAKYQLTLTNATAAPIAISSVGQLIASNALGSSGFQFSNIQTGTVPAMGTLILQFQAVEPGADYNGFNDLIDFLVTPMPGLSVSNPTPGIGAVSGTSASGGTLAVTGTPNGFYSLEVLLVTSGATGTSTAQVSLDGGNTFTAPFTTEGSYPLVGTGLVLEFAGTFTDGDSFTCLASNTSQVQQGTDLQTTSSMSALCSARWATLSPGQPAGAFLFWAQAASSEVAKVLVIPDPTTPGQIDMVVSGPSGPVSGTSLSAVRAYIDPRVMLPATIEISNSTPVTVAITGTIYLATAQAVSAQAAIEAALVEYFNELTLQPLVELADIQGIIRPQAVGGIPGVLNYKNIQLNGAAADYQVGIFNGVAVPDYSGLVYVLQ